MIFWVLAGLAVIMLMQQQLQRRRTDRYNRNVDRYNEMMEKLQQNKDDKEEKNDN